MISQYTILFVDRKFLILCHAFVFNDYISIYTYAITHTKKTRIAGLEELISMVYRISEMAYFVGEILN